MQRDSMFVIEWNLGGITSLKRRSDSEESSNTLAEGQKHPYTSGSSS